MKESDLYIPVRDWLRGRGYTVHVEVFGCDVVAVQGDRLIAVELKLKSPLVVHRQAQRCGRFWADAAYAAMPYRPRKVGIFVDSGVGLLVVSDGAVSVEFESKTFTVPEVDEWYRFWSKRHKYRIKKLSKREPAQDHELAGLPCCPQLREQRLKRLPAPTNGGAP